ncbi:MAG: type II toxin-antitoxin system HipA family toxin [Eggerthellaceae bacterium]|nr:type II toxin-antitoxin system HipA family toxin [Eggerthellaceae bacterium]
MTPDLAVYRLACSSPQRVGTIRSGDLPSSSSFSYDPSYLALPEAVPLSLSLPLRGEPFDQADFRPYFEGLLAEAHARQELAAKLRLREDDWLGLLAACGRDCIGGVLIAPEGEVVGGHLDYEAIDSKRLKLMFQDLPAIAEQNVDMRLSLAGAQGKTGLVHDPQCSMQEGWFVPQGLAATTHILKASPLRDIPEVEFLCMKAAQACGIKTANASLLNCGTLVLAVERFDRKVAQGEHSWQVERLHQEDLCQAFGIPSGSKYAELEGGSVRGIAALLRERSARPARDIAEFARLLVFNYAIGNCDAHLKNYSLLYGNGSGGRCSVSLAPAYDLVSTTYFPRYSRNMAMVFGGVESIDEVTPETFKHVAQDLGITVGALKHLAAPITERLLPALVQAGEGELGDVLKSTPYVADDLANDVKPRLEVLRAFCE